MKITHLNFLLSVFIAVLIIAAALYFIFQMNQRDNYGEQVMDSSIKEEEIEVCEKNSDCIIVPYAHCCGSTKRAINKKYKKLYESKSEWQVFYGRPICNIIGQCVGDANVNTAECREQRCGLKF